MQAATEAGVKPDPDFRPVATVAVGAVGHRSIGIAGEAAEQVLETLTELFRMLADAVRESARIGGPFFADAPPTLRLVGMMSNGADLLAGKAASAAGAEIVCVLPFALETYRADFPDAASARLADTLIATAKSRLELPGTREEGARAYERANDVILSNCDLLIAVWDGARASGRAGTGDVVEAALANGMTVLVVDPAQPRRVQLLVRGPDEPLRIGATDLERRALTRDLVARIVGSVLQPPVGITRRRGYLDFLAEPARSIAWRPEYGLLLRLLSPPRPVAPPKPLGVADPADMPPIDPLLEARLAKLDHVRERAGQLAARYGRLRRSSLVSSYFVLITVACVSGFVGILVPALSETTIAIQLAAAGLVALDHGVGRWRRWRERWMDYRSLAERLRVLRLLQPFGVARPSDRALPYRAKPSWTDWYITRTARMVGLPDIVIGPQELAATVRALADIEIPEQIAYHRSTFRQLGILERRLSSSSNVTLAASILAAGSLLIAKQWGAGERDWAPIASLLLAIFPAAMNAVQGIRSETDLIRLVERSATTAAALVRLRRSVLDPPLTYDRVARSLTLASVLMADELTEWRMVNESRRSRHKRRQALRRVFWKRVLRLALPRAFWRWMVRLKLPSLEPGA